MSARHLICVAVLCIAAVNCEDAWSEDSPSVVPVLVEDPSVAALESPLFLESDGKTVSFNPSIYATLKSHVAQMDGQPFVMKHFVDNENELVLESIQAFAPDGEVRTANSDGTETVSPPPDMIHLHGSVSGDPSSFVLLNLSPRASTGVLQTSSSRRALEIDPNGHSVLLDANADDSWKTKADKYSARHENDSPDEAVAPNQMLAELGKTELTQAGASKYYLTLRIDCDERCVALLKTNANNDPSGYITGLIAGVNVIYKRDLGRELQIKQIKLWDTTSPYDQGTRSLTALRQAFSPNSYDLVHLFTGIQEGGVAYVGTACSGRSGYNTGVSSLRGKWRGTQQASAYNWDLIVTSHEMGHNVGSGHSHDYSPPIDKCVQCRPGFSESQCRSGGGAVGPVQRGSPDCVKGTIMSYCHLCGGITNVEMKFHSRAISKIKQNLNSRCGPAGPAPPSGPPPPPSPPTTKPPVAAPTSAPATNCRDYSTSFCSKYAPKYCSYSVRSSGRLIPMKVYCGKSCNACGGSPPPPPPTPPPTKPCNDVFGACTMLKNAGVCTNSAFKSIAQAQCEKTCGFC